MSKPPEQLMPEEEQQLIKRAKEGDQEALGQLLAAHQDRVFRTALSLVRGDEDKAAEVAQSVLISAFRHMEQFQGAAKFSTWLYRMTVNFSKNQAVSEGRRKARFVSMTAPKKEGSEEMVQRDFATGNPSPSDEAAAREELRILEEHLNGLADDYRLVLTMRYWEDASYDEISDALSIPLGTVKSRINRARAELRKRMKDVLETEDLP